MINQKILEFKEAIYDCAKDFRHQANFMMKTLASTYSFQIQPSISFPKEVYRHYNNKGILNGEWNFYFHGSHCRFEHLNTGQVIEVLFTHSPEFGYINSFYFYQFIKTTDKYKWLAEVCNNEDVDDVIALLLNDCLLIRVISSVNENLVLAIY